MRKVLIALALAFSLVNTWAQSNPDVARADSIWLFSYATTKNGGRNGLHFAWSMDRKTWNEIGPEWAPVKSDYGTWGAEKRMIKPELSYDPVTKLWEARWLVNDTARIHAYTYSEDLCLWKPQDYVEDPLEKPRRRPVVYDELTDLPVPELMPKKDPIEFLTLPFSGKVRGQIHRVKWDVVSHLIAEQKRQQGSSELNSERAADDMKGRFNDLKSQLVTIDVYNEGRKAISDKLIGIFFEDINYAADGGLYAELLQNRDFEYTPRDFHNNPEWNATSHWEAAGGLEFAIDNQFPLNANNPHYAVIKAKADSTGNFGSLSNLGWEGITVKAGAKYDFSLYGCMPVGIRNKMTVQLQRPDGTVLATGFVMIPKGNRWRRSSYTLKPNADADDARLVLIPQAEGEYQIDMCSLFPRNTYKGRKNGMRKDLAEALEALHPQFVRFPGGCVAHGNGLDNMYRWKNTIGPLYARKPNWNIWNYHQSVGLGYYEYFRFCEDLGAEPLPVLAAGVPCQNSSVGGAGQQGGIPMAEMDAYIQDVLDLIEWANGDPKKSRWARMRADAGHSAPFNLKMIGIGNEDLISDVFTERYRMICEAVAKKYPEVKIVGTVGPFNEGSDYEWGWKLAREMQLPYVDEHYYQSPGWFINNQNFYDSYAREVEVNGEMVPATQVYLGEYASHIPGRKNCLETALSEALYLCSVERNADVVAMTSYAPLLAKKGHTQWNPDLIYFTNNSISLTTGYQVQKLFGQNSGTTYIPSRVQLEQPDMNVQKRIGSSVVIDPKTGDLILKVVNYLPVENRVHVNLPVGYSEVKQAQVLTGNLADTEAVPVKLGNIERGEDSSITFDAPAYSFIVLRIF